jgi:NAD-dependent SIR2 family protein deacetylase
VVLAGAGVLAESDVPTFRDALTGLWSNFKHKRSTWTWWRLAVDRLNSGMAPRKKQRYTPLQRHDYVEQFGRSGLKQAEFCRRAKLHPMTFGTIRRDR